MLNDNPFLHLDNIPAFDNLRAEDIAPALHQTMAEARAAIDHMIQNPEITWDNTMTILDDCSERVSRIWSVVGHIHSVADSPKWREVYNAHITLVSHFFTEISQKKELYQRFEKIMQHQLDLLNPAQKRKLSLDLRDFELSGAKLPADKADQLADCHAKSAQLSATFSQNVLDATDAFALYFDDAQALDGVPETALAMFAAAATAEGKSGYKIGLQAPHYLAIMQYANDRSLRHQLHYAYGTRASDLDAPERDNGQTIDQILQLAQQEADLLGFETYADLSLVTKMASTPAEVMAFVRDMAAKARPFAEKDLQKLQKFAKEIDGISQLKPWDIAYYSEKLREADYAFSQEALRLYFPHSKVLQGLFDLIFTLYGVRFVAESRPVWHPDVRFFRLEKNQQTIGGVYLDLFARNGKRSGAWMNDYCGRKRLSDGSLQLPLAYLVCNFTPPTATEEAFLTHDEIITLFHEMGHGLHHLLTEVDELSIAGINSVEWDAVELPSQFMENFAWAFDVLVTMSAHKNDGSTLPRALYDKMYAAKNFQTGLFLLRQMEFALFDMSIYAQKNQPCDWRQMLDEIRDEVAIVPQAEYNRFAHSFGHIFAGGYAAGYYSYLWAEVLSADVYAAFEEENQRSTTGARFWRTLLSQGALKSMADLFMDFRGRTPSADALLRHLGLQ